MILGHYDFRTKQTAIEHLRAWAFDTCGLVSLRGWQDLTHDQLDGYEFYLTLLYSVYMADYGLDVIAGSTAIELSRSESAAHVDPVEMLTKRRDEADARLRKEQALRAS